MNPPATPYTWTYAEYARFPDDGNRYEVIDGEVLVTPAPSPNHQNVVAELLTTLRGHVKQHGLGVVLADVYVLFATGHVLRPDIVFVPTDRRSAAPTAASRSRQGSSSKYSHPRRAPSTA